MSETKNGRAYDEWALWRIWRWLYNYRRLIYPINYNWSDICRILTLLKQ